MPEARITAIYMLLASIWIIGSDRALEAMIDGISNSVLAQTIKGLNFVFTTGLLLFFVLRRAYGGWRRSEQQRVETIRAARECYRKLSNKILTMREDERTRISREIHDELGQLLTGVKLRIRLIENRIANRNDRSLNPLIDELVDVSATIDDSIVAVRRISSGLRPATLDDLGLAVALKEEAGQFTKRTGIPCILRIEEIEDPLRPELETAAFRIFQESLTNVSRHARASRVDAECVIHDGVLSMVIRDDGVGLPPEVTVEEDSLGLVGMQERAAEAGGRLEVDSPAGSGTIVRLSIPLAPQNPNPIIQCH